MIESEKQLNKPKIPLPLGLAKPCLEAKFKNSLIYLKRFALKFPLRKL